MLRNHARAFWAALAVFALLAVGASPAWGDYVAYAVSKKGDERPLPEDLGPLTKNAKNLISVRWGEYTGKKFRIGVLPASNESTVASYRFTGPDGQTMTWSAETDLNQVPVNGIDAILTDVLQNTGRFDIVERPALEEILAEQDLGASGRVAQPSAAKTGAVLGAQYQIQVVVNSYEPGVSKKKGGLGGITRGLLGGIKGGKNKTYVSMTFKLINSETSVVEASEIVETYLSSVNVDLGGIGWGGAGVVGGFLSNYSKTPIGQAVIAAVNAGVFGIIKEVGNQPLSGSVVKVDGSSVIVNLGEEFVRAGETLVAFSKGEEMVDPETGLVLGSEDEEIGRLKVTDVKDKYSYAQPVGFDAARLHRGDRVVSTQAAPDLQFGSPWK